jgi:hypothetical protein
MGLQLQAAPCTHSRHVRPYDKAVCPHDASFLRSVTMRAASAFILARCSSESRCRASSRLMTSKNAGVGNPC